MPDPGQTPVQEYRQLLDVETMREWVESRRWYASKSRHVTGVEIEESVLLADPPALVVALVSTRFTTGSHELYQLPLGFRRTEEMGDQEAILSLGEWTVYDALTDAEQPSEVLRRIDAGDQIETEAGCLRFLKTDCGVMLGQQRPVQQLSGEQSNTSLRFGERVVLKFFRRLEPGINPELEMLRYLTSHGFASIAPLLGWYEYEGRSFSATLGVVQEFLPDAVDGWRLALGDLVDQPERFLERLHSLGTVTAEMHNALSSDPSDVAFAPEEPSQEALALLTATVDEDIERLFSRLPDDERLAPIAGRGQDVRERMAMRANVGSGGRAIRTHGDFHLGQTLHTERGWVIIDFEGEPARPLTERRYKRSPLRDVAGMLRSFAYACSAVEIQQGTSAPEDFELRAREAFLAGYFGSVDMALLPGGESAIRSLLAVFELEKAVYELRYELDNRPDWVSIPVAGIERLVQS